MKPEFLGRVARVFDAPVALVEHRLDVRALESADRGLKRDEIVTVRRSKNSSSRSAAAESLDIKPRSQSTDPRLVPELA
jgi:hypothetical protein